MQRRTLDQMRMLMTDGNEDHSPRLRPSCWCQACSCVKPTWQGTQRRMAGPPSAEALATAAKAAAAGPRRTPPVALGFWAFWDLS